MTRHETRNTVTDSTTTGPIVQIGTASGPIIGPGPQHNDLRTGRGSRFHGDGATYIESTNATTADGVTSIPLDLI
ncbi:hypothetical protein ACFC26_12605 [Kitasatospora purpeofusca]|uniref:hypothetical protein n=1 Tax=Kitasatospora purpeofusca TaxID=67352 RepID=UPI0035E27A2B